MPKVTITDAKGLVQTTGGGTFVEGVLHQRHGGGQDTVKYAVPAAALGTGNLTITIAQIKTGILEEDPAGDATWTLPTNALLRAGLDDPQTGDTLDFCVINTGTAGADEDITVAAGSGGTLVGSGHCPTSWTTHDADRGGSALFRIRITSATAHSIYRLA